MILILRIVFTVLSALCVGAIIPVGIFGDWLYAMMCGFGGFLFFILMMLCKQTMDGERYQSAHPAQMPTQNGKNDENNEKMNGNG